MKTFLLLALVMAGFAGMVDAALSLDSGVTITAKKGRDGGKGGSDDEDVASRSVPKSLTGFKPVLLDRFAVLQVAGRH